MTSVDLHPTDYDEALARLHRGYAALLALVEDFPEEKREQPGACGSWTPRQVVAHLSGWLTEALTRYKAIQAGDPTNVHYDWQTDFAGFNQESVAARAGLNWDDTVAELRTLEGAFYDQAQAVTTADTRYDEWLDGLWKDCVEHMGQLMRFADERL